MSITKQLEGLGYSITSTLSIDNYDGREGSHTHLVSIGLNGHTMACEFTSGCGNRTHPRTGKEPVSGFGRLSVHDHKENQKTVPNAPNLPDVLYSLLSDSSMGLNGESYGEFCDNFGYDEDSRAHFRVYEACLDQYSKMKRLGVDFDALEEIMEGY